MCDENGVPESHLRFCILPLHTQQFTLDTEQFRLAPPFASLFHLGDPFLRVAMGWRDGHSCRGLGELLGELALHKSFEALDRAYGR